MNMDSMIGRVEQYLSHSNDTRPRIVNLQQTEQVNAFRGHFSLGNAAIRTPQDYCAPDEDLQVDQLFYALSQEQGQIILMGVTAQLKLKGRTALQQFLRTFATMSFQSARVVLVCCQCEELLHFPDKRLQKLVYLADGDPETLPKVCFVGADVPALKGIKTLQGIEKLGFWAETLGTKTLYMQTKRRMADYPWSVYITEEIPDAYAALCRLDPATGQLAQSSGTPDQWSYALKTVSEAGDWSAYVQRSFGSIHALDSLAGKWVTLDNSRRWLAFQVMKLFGAGKNWCLNQALQKAKSLEELVPQLYRCILTEDWQSEPFRQRYQERKDLLRMMAAGEHETEARHYVSLTKQFQREALHYLTDGSRVEREAIIDHLAAYGSTYTQQELYAILSVVYPDLAAYLSDYPFPDLDWLAAYFREYRYSKVNNQISEPLRQLADAQARDRDFLKLPTRISLVDKVPQKGTFLYFVDAMGAEFIPYIAQKCRQYGLACSVRIAHCELPSLTRFNKEFFEQYPEGQRQKVSELDDIIHHGKENYDYQVTKTPLHLIRELEIMDDVLRKALDKLESGKNRRILISADHGATRMAVINEKVINIDVNSKGTHCGRVCAYTDDVKTIEAAIPEGEYYILASYDRFKGGRAADVEAHGGATPEETIVPVICLTLPGKQIHVTVKPYRIPRSYKEPGVLKLFSDGMLHEPVLYVQGTPFTAERSIDGQNFAFTLKGLVSGKYTAELWSDGMVVAEDLHFELVSRAGSSTNKGGIL